MNNLVKGKYFVFLKIKSCSLYIIIITSSVFTAKRWQGLSDRLSLETRTQWSNQDILVFRPALSLAGETGKLQVAQQKVVNHRFSDQLSVHNILTFRKNDQREEYFDNFWMSQVWPLSCVIVITSVFGLTGC